MSNFEKELKRLIVILLQNIAYCKYNGAFSSHGYENELNSHECALSSLTTLARNCGVNIVGLQGSYCGCVVTTGDYELRDIQMDWL